MTLGVSRRPCGAWGDHFGPFGAHGFGNGGGFAALRPCWNWWGKRGFALNVAERASGLFVGGGARWQPWMLQGPVSTGNGAHWRDPGLPGWPWAGSLISSKVFEFILSFPTSLFSLQNGITGFAARRLFLYCGVGDCRVVSNLEIAGIADSEQN